MKETTLLIIGAGPYGLAAAAYAGSRGIDFILVGKPMDFWKAHMPEGMLLRSGVTWHMDPTEVHTFEAFLKTKGLERSQVEPIRVDLFLEYGHWFADRNGLRAVSSAVKGLSHAGGRFEALLADGQKVSARYVFAAPGFRYFAHVPESLEQMIPRDHCTHTCDLVDFKFLAGKRCLIVGGRQSAFEWAALLGEQGADEVHLCYRHETPRLEESDWLWVDPMMDLTAQIRGWFRRLPADQQESIRKRFWAEGRLKLEPWLEPRIRNERIRLWPNSFIQSCRRSGRGAIDAVLSNETSIPVDHIVFATGYRVSLDRVPYLMHPSLLPAIDIRDGFPVLDEDFQTSLSGLFLSGLVATQDFGPFFGFVIGCKPSARIVIDRIFERSRAA